MTQLQAATTLTLTVTRIGRLSETKKQLLREHLSSAGELLRLDQLTIDPADLARQGIRQGQLFS